MNLKDEIRKIAELQETDLQLYNLRREKEVTKPAGLAQVKEALLACKESFSLKEEELKAANLARKEKEIDLASREENLKKNQGQLYQLKTNKEYQAKLNEIESSKADLAVAEESLLKFMEEAESAKAALEREKAGLDEAQNKFNEQETRVKAEIADIDIKINNLSEKRKIFTKDIDSKILSKYEQLLQTRQGLALVPVEENHCGACHMLLNHQKINQIKMYLEPILCDSCVRILYIPDDLKL